MDCCKLNRISAIPFSVAAPCSCWRPGRYARSTRSMLSKSCPPLRARKRSSAKHLDARASSQYADQREAEHALLESCKVPSKEEISPTLGPEIFACLLKKDPRPCSEFREDTVDNLKEQISQLMAMLEQERRDYRLAQDKMKTAHKEEIEQLMQKNQEGVRKLQKLHAVEYEGLVTRGKSTVEEQQRTMEKKLDESKKDLERLAITFRSYKESLLDRTNEKWQMLEAQWRETHEEEKEKSLTLQNQTLMKAAKQEKNDLWLRAQQEMCAMQQKHSEEIEYLHRKHEELRQDYQLRESEKAVTQSKLAQMLEELELLKKAAQDSQRQVDQLKKNLLGAQKLCEEQMRSVDAQYRRTIQTMREENADLRRRQSASMGTMKASCLTSSKDENAEPRPKLLFMPPGCCYQIYRPPRKCPP